MIDGRDLYMVPDEFETNQKNFPCVSYPDLVNYLIFKPSPSYELKTLKNIETLKVIIVTIWIYANHK